MPRARTVARNIQRQKQDLWFCTYTEQNVGVDRVKVYDKPIHKEMSVSATAGYIYSWGAGLSLSYDRYVTSYDRDFQPEEGTAVFVDVEPSIDRYGNLTQHKVLEFKIDGVTPRLDENGEQIFHYEYDTVPDYFIRKVMDSQRGIVARYGLKKT